MDDDKNPSVRYPTNLSPPPRDSNPSGSHGTTVRRPMNAFLIFCKRHRAVVREKNSHLDNRSVTRILGELWANLPPDEKSVYTEVAKQYKEAFMRANPEYKWHDSSRTNQTASVTVKSPTKLLPGQPLTLPRQTTPGVNRGTSSGITPGKLADPSNMGGLSLLLAAGQHSLSPPGGSTSTLPPADRNQASNLDLECHETEEDLSELEHVEDLVRSQQKKTPLVANSNNNTVTMTTAPPGDNQKLALFQLAEMCSTQFKTPTNEKAEPLTATDHNPPPVSLPGACFLTYPWTQQPASFPQPQPQPQPQNIADKYPAGLDLTTKKTTNGSQVPMPGKPHVDLYCHEQVTCPPEINRGPIGDPLIHPTHQLPGFALQRPANQLKSGADQGKPGEPKMPIADLNTGKLPRGTRDAAADLLRVLNAPTKVDPNQQRPGAGINNITPELKPISPARPEKLGDFSQMMVERVIETVYSRDLTSVNPLQDQNRLRLMQGLIGQKSSASPLQRLFDTTPSNLSAKPPTDVPTPHKTTGESRAGKPTFTFGDIQETLIRQAVEDPGTGADFAIRVKEQLKKVTSGAVSMTTAPPWGKSPPSKQEMQPKEYSVNKSDTLDGTMTGKDTKTYLKVKDRFGKGQGQIPEQFINADTKVGTEQKQENNSGQCLPWWNSPCNLSEIKSETETNGKSTSSGDKSEPPLDCNAQKMKLPRKKALSESSDGDNLFTNSAQLSPDDKTIKPSKQTLIKKIKSESDAIDKDSDSCHGNGFGRQGLSECMEYENEADVRGRRKSKRSNRGQRYKELLSQGVLQPGRRKPETSGDDNNNHHQGTVGAASRPLTLNPETCSTDTDTDFVPGVTKRMRRRTVSETAKEDNDQLPRYRPGDFDLEAHIASLPVCKLETSLPPVKPVKARSRSVSNHGDENKQSMKKRFLARLADQEKEKCQEPLNIAELHSVTKNTQQVAAGVSTTQSTVTGSRKRKARKQAITHLLPMPADSNTDLKPSVELVLGAVPPSSEMKSVLDAEPPSGEMKENEDLLNQIVTPGGQTRHDALTKPAVENSALSALADVAMAEHKQQDPLVL